MQLDIKEVLYLISDALGIVVRIVVPCFLLSLGFAFLLAQHLQKKRRETKRVEDEDGSHFQE